MTGSLSLSFLPLILDQKSHIIKSIYLYKIKMTHKDIHLLTVITTQFFSSKVCDGS